jgi:hypothetical protein
MKTYTNTVIINGEEFTNKVNANTYKEALILHKEIKHNSNYKFKGRLILSDY